MVRYIPPKLDRKVVAEPSRADGVDPDEMPYDLSKGSDERIDTKRGSREMRALGLMYDVYSPRHKRHP